jgi:dCTP deaminase
MVLSDRDIRKRVQSGSLVVEPFIESNVEPASLDICLGTSFKEPVETGQIIDTRSDDGQPYRSFEADSIVLGSGESILATTDERVEIPKDLAADAVGRSSLGRLFVSVHETAGFCDPGYHGEITLEMTNENPNPIRLHAGDRICQLVFRELTSPAERPYGHEKSQYQDQIGATKSGMNFD